MTRIHWRFNAPETILLVMALTFLIMAFTGCGSSSSGPTPVPPAPVVHPVTLTGHLTATNGGQAIAGAQTAVGAANVITGADGGFSASTPPTGAASLSFTAPSIVPRSLMIQLTGSRDMAVDAIALGGQFDLSFYRLLVRDAVENLGLQPLRRWTTNTNLYLQTGTDARTLDMVEQVVRASVAEWSNGRIGVAAVERGDGSRQGQAGWLSVVFAQDAGPCGLSDVGLSGGVIIIRPQAAGCGCAGYSVKPTVIRHEVGHSLGFYHTQDVTDVMFPRVDQCDIPITSRERYHAAIAYSRPVGNLDPDSDGSGTINLAPMRMR